MVPFNVEPTEAKVVQYYTRDRLWVLRYPHRVVQVLFNPLLPPCRSVVRLGGRSTIAERSVNRLQSPGIQRVSVPREWLPG